MHVRYSRNANRGAHVSNLILIATAIASLLMAANSPHPILVFLTGVVFMLAIALLWPKAGPPTLLLAFGLQWLSVALKPIQTALARGDLNSFSERGADLLPAAYLGLAGLAALVIGMRVGAGNSGSNLNWRLQTEVARMPERLVVRASLIAIFAGHTMDALSSQMGPARSIALAISDVRLAGLFILTVWSLSTGKRPLLLSSVIIFELIFGMTGFFSDFKFALLIILISAAVARPYLSPTSFMLGTMALLLLFLANVYWSAIKPEYRTFLNAGSGQQVITQSMSARLQYLQGAAGAFDQEDFERGVDSLVKRQSYIDFLASTLEYVPAIVPHEDGQRTAKAVTHVLTPRVLFPGKPPLEHDTFVTMRYTGLSFGNAQLTSVSIGWLGELYVDFSTLGAIAGAFVIGVFIGIIHKTILGYPKEPLVLNLSLAAAAMLPFIVFERSLIKLVGGGLMTFAATLVLQRIVIPRALEVIGASKLLRRKQMAKRASH